MGVLKYVKTHINKLNTLSQSIFKSYHSDIDNLRKKNKIINNNIGTYKYDIKDVFDITIKSNAGNLKQMRSLLYFIKSDFHRQIY